MATYRINLNNRESDWIAEIKTYLTVKDTPIEIRNEKNIFHTRISAFEGLMLRFNDLDFENDHIVINNMEANSIHDMAMIFEHEFQLSKIAQSH